MTFMLKRAKIWLILPCLLLLAAEGNPQNSVPTVAIPVYVGGRISGDISLAMGLSLGYKLYTNVPDGGAKDRPFDATANVGVTFPFSDMYITPGVHAAFVTRDDKAVANAGFSDEFIAWAGVHVGYNLGI